MHKGTEDPSSLTVLGKRRVRDGVVTPQLVKVAPGQRVYSLLQQSQPLLR